MNLFALPVTGKEQKEEIVDLLLPDQGLRIERIISTGQASPDGFWYDQKRDEWVALLQGEAAIRWADGRLEKLKAGDWLLIPAHQRHRVEWTSKKPPCIWLAIHGKIC